MDHSYSKWVVNFNSIQRQLNFGCFVKLIEQSGAVNFRQDALLLGQFTKKMNSCVLSRKTERIK